MSSSWRSALSVPIPSPPPCCFEPDTSHVIPALTCKFLAAREAARAGCASSVVVRGTGSPTREFLYVEDAAEGILLATEHYNDSAPVNLG